MRYRPLAREPVRRPQYVAQKAAEARDENAWAFWLEVERAVKELLTVAARPRRRTRRSIDWLLTRKPG